MKNIGNISRLGEDSKTKQGIVAFNVQNYP